MGTRIDLENVFHGGDEGGVAVGRDYPLLALIRFGSAFFSVRPMVLSLAATFELDFIVFQRSIQLAKVKGPDVLLAVEVAEPSLNYDLHASRRSMAPWAFKNFGSSMRRAGDTCILG